MDPLPRRRAEGTRGSRKPNGLVCLLLPHHTHRSNLHPPRCKRVYGALFYLIRRRNKTRSHLKRRSIVLWALLLSGSSDEVVARIKKHESVFFAKLRLNLFVFEKKFKLREGEREMLNERSSYYDPTTY